MTSTILNTGDTLAVAVSNFQAAIKANYVVVDQKTNDDDSVRETLYQSKVGSKMYPKTVRLGSYVSKNANDGLGSRSTSVRLTTYLQETDADTNIIWTHPLPVVISVNVPGEDAIPDISDVQELVMEAFAFLCQITAGAVVDGGATGDLAYRITSTALEYENTGA